MASTITILSIGDRVIGPYGKGRITAIDEQRCEVTYDQTISGGEHPRSATETSDWCDQALLKPDQEAVRADAKN